MASGNDIKAAEKTYGGFINFLKWGTIACVILTAFVVVVIQ